MLLRNFAAVGSVVLLIAFGSAQSPRPATTSEQKTIETDYVYALSAADTFLNSWSTREAEIGMKLLSGRLLKKIGNHLADQYIFGLSNPHHEGFEINPGKKLQDGRYSFHCPPVLRSNGQQRAATGSKIGKNRYETQV